MNDGIFLLGGETKDVLPIPMLLHSGDIIIMNGKSRRVTHGISCIIKNTIQKDILHGLVDHTLANITLPIHLLKQKKLLICHNSQNLKIY